MSNTEQAKTGSVYPEGQQDNAWTELKCPECKADIIIASTQDSKHRLLCEARCGYETPYLTVDDLFYIVTQSKNIIRQLSEQINPSLLQACRQLVDQAGTCPAYLHPFTHECDYKGPRTQAPDCDVAKMVQCWIEHFTSQNDLPTCRKCGCTDDNACEIGCFWAEPNLCSACVKPGWTPEEQLATMPAGGCARCGSQHALDGTWRFNGENWEHRCADVHPQAGHWEIQPEVQP